MAELGLHRSGGQGRADDTVTAHAAQRRQTLVHLHRPQTRGLTGQSCGRTIVLEAERTVDAQIDAGLGVVAIGIGHCLHQGQHTAVQGQADAVIMAAGITVPDIVQQLQGHGASGRIYGEGEVAHPVGAAGNDIAHLVEHYLSALAIGGQRINRIEAARHIAAIEGQVVADVARTIRTEGMAELGLHHGCRQGRTAYAIAVCTIQGRQALVHADHTQFTGPREQAHAGYVIQYHHIQTGAGAVTVAVRQHNIEAFGQSSVIGRLGVSLVIAQGVAVSHSAGACHRVVADACHQQLIAQRARDRLRETADDLTVTDEYHATQSQALDAICRIEGEGAALGQAGSIRAAAIGQCRFIQNKLAPFDLQPAQGDCLIRRGNGDGQSGVIGIVAIGHYVVGWRHRACVIECRSEGVGAVGIDDEGAYPVQ